MVFGPLLFILLAVLAIILLVIGLTTFLWLPLLVIGAVGVLWLPVAGWLRAQTAGSGGGAGTDPSGVPTTSEASYDPVQQQPQDQSHG
jgi:hypothetical protein